MIPNAPVPARPKAAARTTARQNRVSPGGTPAAPARPATDPAA